LLVFTFAGTLERNASKEGKMKIAKCGREQKKLLDDVVLPVVGFLSHEVK